MSKERDELREIIEKLIRYQKIPCSVDCPTKTGIELVSLDQAKSSIIDLFISKLAEKAFEGDIGLSIVTPIEYQKGYVNGVNETLRQSKKNFKEMK